MDGRFASTLHGDNVTQTRIDNQLDSTECITLKDLRDWTIPRVFLPKRYGNAVRRGFMCFARGREPII